VDRPRGGDTVWRRGGGIHHSLHLHRSAGGKQQCEANLTGR